MTDLNKSRERDAKRKLLFYHGRTDTHPHGISGKNWIIPYDFSKSLWDTSKDCPYFGEWANACGFNKLEG